VPPNGHTLVKGQAPNAALSCSNTAFCCAVEYHRHAMFESVLHTGEGLRRRAVAIGVPYRAHEGGNSVLHVNTYMGGCTQRRCCKCRTLNPWSTTTPLKIMWIRMVTPALWVVLRAAPFTPKSAMVRQEAGPRVQGQPLTCMLCMRRLRHLRALGDHRRLLVASSVPHSCRRRASSHCLASGVGQLHVAVAVAGAGGNPWGPGACNHDGASECLLRWKGAGMVRTQRDVLHLPPHAEPLAQQGSDREPGCVCCPPAPRRQACAVRREVRHSCAALGSMDQLQDARHGREARGLTSRATQGIRSRCNS
jgi:hypothetical protein